MRSAGCWFNLKTLTRTVPPRRKDLPNAELIVLAVKRLETGLSVKIIPSVFIVRRRPQNLHLAIQVGSSESYEIHQTKSGNSMVLRRCHLA